MKKKTIIISIVFLIMAFAILAIVLNVNKKSNRQIFGVWWWNDELDLSYLDFAQKQGVTEIYYCSSHFNEQTENFIKSAEKKDIDVYWLSGEYQWIYDYDSLKTNINRFLEYQENYSHVFKGIHFDIEPHQHPEFETKRAEIIKDFVELCFKIKKDFPNIYVEYDLPFWLDDEIEVNGETKSAFKFVIDVASRVTIMSYRDTSEEIFDVSEDEINYAVSLGKTINLGVETKSSEGDKVSFMEEGKAVMNHEIKRLRKKIPDSCGIVVHQIYTWFNLPE